MTAEGHKVASLHGAKDASERDEIIDRFREGHEKVLITTNVIARGIDILQVNVVVNYDLPMMSDKSESSTYDPRFETPDIETYLHRIGISVSYFVIGTRVDVLPQVARGGSAERVYQSISCTIRRHGKTCT